MIYDRFENIARYQGFSARFATAFAFLGRAGLASLPEGRVDLIPGEVWATVMRKLARKAEDALFENHSKFADIQCCVEGEEQFGWHGGASPLSVAKPFDAEKDVEMLHGPIVDFLPLRAGRFAVLFPGEPHAPMIGAGQLTKIVLKVLVT